MSILLPFVFGMDPYSGVALLIGMAAVIHTGDTFPSILIGVPGSSGSQATIVDGYPLARQGKAAMALGAAFFVSMIGGRSEEHTSELQSLMRISYAVFCLKKKKIKPRSHTRRSAT